MKEIWKPITELGGLYEISNFGKVKRISRKVNSQIQKCGYRIIKESIVKPCDNGSGYKAIMPQINNKRKVIYIHRLVADYFIPNPDNSKEVNHKDLNKSNNHVSNLEWCDRKENYHHFLSNTERDIRAKSGFVGVCRSNTVSETHEYRLTHNGVHYNKYGFKTKYEAALARDSFIIDNNLPNRLNILKP